MTPLGWGWAGFVWGYALLWFLVNDNVKLLAYRIFDPVKAEAKPNAKMVSKPETKAEPKSEAIVEPKPEAKTEPKPGAKAEIESGAETKPAVEPKPEAKEGSKPEAKAKTPPDLTPQIAKRAYELYEERARKDGPAVQDWEKAEREIRKDEAKAETKPEVIAETKPEAKNDPKPEAKDESKPDAKAKTPPDLTPQIVKRVHELYEELGREDVRAVQDWEKAERETRKAEVKAEPKPNK
jgi:hypothetical protein